MRPAAILLAAVLSSASSLALAGASPGAGPVSLSEAFDAAVKRSESLSIQDQQVLQGQARVDQAKGAILPNLAANGTYLVQETPSDPLVKEFFPATQPQVALTLTQPLFRGLREFATLRQLKHTTRAQEYARSYAYLQLYNDVAQSYFTVFTLEQDLADLKTEAGLYQDRVDELRQRARSGLSSKSDVLTVESSRAVILAQMRQVLGQLKSSRENFAFLTGLPSDTSLAPVAPGNPEAARVEDYVARIEQRGDVQSARESVSASEENVSVAKGGHLPTADLVGNYYLVRPQGVVSQIHWDVQARLSIPIYSGGTVSAAVREAAAQQSQADLTLTRARRQAEEEIRSLHATYAEDLQQIAALQQALTLAENNYQVLRRDYRAGLTRNLDVLQGLTSFQEIKRSLDRARFTAKNDLIRLRSAAGIGPAPGN